MTRRLLPPLLPLVLAALLSALPAIAPAQGVASGEGAGATAPAEQLVLGLSQTRVAITTNFDGSEILIFGAVKREAPQIDPGAEVVITVAGPTESIAVLRKQRVAGIWVNTDQVTIRQAPSFYAVATTAPLEEVLTATEDLRQRISIPRAVRSITSRDEVTDEDAFVEALLRIRQRQGLYQLREGTIRFDEQTLFRTQVPLPSSLPTGVYTVNVYLLRNGSLAARHETSIRVGKVGMEQWLYALSREQSVLYALLAIVVAVLSGWGASEIFRLLRRQ
ncbi:TIGR02186 family protein [Oceanicola sp. S124]|uniref:TIGR02186 family protein n=1 Tax=Oceanicola sp. S124 TaxID=1042378 RepID=UPI0002558295|nr:TIGR02186 family protein [Oceanicola sp. S124]